MIIFKSILFLSIYFKTIVSVTGTSSKMASLIFQKWLTIFCQKAQNFVLFWPYYFVQISPACGPNTYQRRYGEIFNVSISNGNIKCPIGKSIFAVNLPLNLFRATVANTVIGSLRSLHKFLTKYLYHMLV